MCSSAVMLKLLAVQMLILFGPECATTTTSTPPPGTVSGTTTTDDLEIQAFTEDSVNASMTANTGTKDPSEGPTTYSTYTSTYNTADPADESKLRPGDCTGLMSDPKGNFEIDTDGLLKRDEGDQQLVTCEMKPMKNHSECNDALRELMNSTKIFMHEASPGKGEKWEDHEILANATKNVTVQADGSDSLFSVQFNFTLLHKHHDSQKIYCRASNDNLTVISPKIRFRTEINKLYKVSMTPHHVEVPPKTAFKLTCTIHDNDVKGWIVWKSKRSSADYPKYTTVERHGYSNIQQIGNSSILTVTKPGEWNGTYLCTTNLNTHQRSHVAKVTVLVKNPDKTVVHGTTIGVTISLLLVVVIVVALLIRRRALKKKIEISLMLMDLQEAGAQSARAARVGSMHSLNMDPAVNCYASSLNPDGSLAAETLAATFARFTTMYSAWQKDRSLLVIKEILGEGNFGSVCLGIMPDVYFQGISSQVAVKTIKPARMDKNAITEFEKEVSIMSTLQHESIVSLVGLCTETMPLYIIMEYMENGPLNDFLMGKAPNKLEETTLSTRDLIYMSLQPCKALEYLSEKNVVHRDISARNCLVGDKLKVKLADFGLSRGTAVDDGKNYYKKDGGMVPVKWMAPEALNFGKYTSANDVWSFGVLMWEVFSFGAIPYLAHSNPQVIVFVNRGGRLEKPDFCPQSMWEHICSCWTKDPGDRITIGGLVNMLSTELDIIDTSGDNGHSSQQ